MSRRHFSRAAGVVRIQVYGAAGDSTVTEVVTWLSLTARIRALARRAWWTTPCGTTCPVAPSRSRPPAGTVMRCCRWPTAGRLSRPVRSAGCCSRSSGWPPPGAATATGTGWASPSSARSPPRTAAPSPPGSGRRWPARSGQDPGQRSRGHPAGAAHRRGRTASCHCRGQGTARHHRGWGCCGILTVFFSHGPGAVASGAIPRRTPSVRPGTAGSWCRCPRAEAALRHRRWHRAGDRGSQGSRGRACTRRTSPCC
jgi:hypothetical protein